MYLTLETMTVGGDSKVVAYNHAHDGGAIFLVNGTLNINSNASLTFSHNAIGSKGGAVYLGNGELITN